MSIKFDNIYSSNYKRTISKMKLRDTYSIDNSELLEGFIIFIQWIEYNVIKVML